MCDQFKKGKTLFIAEKQKILKDFDVLPKDGPKSVGTKSGSMNYHPGNIR